MTESQLSREVRRRLAIIAHAEGALRACLRWWHHLLRAPVLASAAMAMSSVRAGCGVAAVAFAVECDADPDAAAGERWSGWRLAIPHYFFTLLFTKPDRGFRYASPDEATGSPVVLAGRRRANNRGRVIIPAPASRTRAPIVWGLAVGAFQAASPVAFWWLEPATVLALELVLIAAVYIGFAVADGRPTVIVVECAVAGIFVLLAATAVTASAWILVVGYTGHGLKDAWQQRRRYVANTRWWPPFCAAVDWLVAAVLVIEITAGLDFH